jgi:hypothetical protein
MFYIRNGLYHIAKLFIQSSINTILFDVCPLTNIEYTPLKYSRKYRLFSPQAKPYKYCTQLYYGICVYSVGKEVEVVFTYSGAWVLHLQ